MRNTSYMGAHLIDMYLKYRRVSRTQACILAWTYILGMGAHLRYGCTSQVWACISGMGVHLRYGCASQVWVCISGMGVHLRYGYTSQVGVCISGMGCASQVWGSGRNCWAVGSSPWVGPDRLFIEAQPMGFSGPPSSINNVPRNRYPF
jgi:hypothetical protein